MSDAIFATKKADVLPGTPAFSWLLGYFAM
jgi:hypothetical protein